MILVYDVKVKEVTGDFAHLYNWGDPFESFSDLASNLCSYPNPFGCTECVQGKRYLLPSGKEIFIGLDEKTRKFLEIPLDGVYELSKQVESLLSEKENLQRILRRRDKRIIALKLELDPIKDAGFLTRLRWAFTGILDSRLKAWNLKARNLWKLEQQLPPNTTDKA